MVSRVVIWEGAGAGPCHTWSSPVLTQKDTVYVLGSWTVEMEIPLIFLCAVLFPWGWRGGHGGIIISLRTVHVVHGSDSALDGVQKILF